MRLTFVRRRPDNCGHWSGDAHQVSRRCAQSAHVTRTTGTL